MPYSRRRNKFRYAVTDAMGPRDRATRRVIIVEYEGVIEPVPQPSINIEVTERPNPKLGLPLSNATCESAASALSLRTNTTDGLRVFYSEHH